MLIGYGLDWAHLPYLFLRDFIFINHLLQPLVGIKSRKEKEDHSVGYVFKIEKEETPTEW